MKSIIPYIIIILVVILIRIFCFSIIRVNGVSMDPNLSDGDLMILDKVSYYFNDISRFDIVVIETNEELIIKRVIGLPGETVEYKDNKLYINDELVEENFERASIEDHVFEQVVPTDSYIVIGDNRANSKDSRILGTIEEKEIIGKANLTIYPFDRLGIKE